MRLTGLLFIFLLLAAGCAVEPDSNNVDATIEAAVSATRESERTRAIPVRPTKAASQPGLFALPTQTPTPFPTPPPQVASPGKTEDGLRHIARCYRESTAFRAYMTELFMADWNITREEAEAMVYLIVRGFEDEETSIPSLMEMDLPDLHMFAILGDRPIDEICPLDDGGKEPTGSFSFADAPEDLTEKDAREIAGQFYDCLEGIQQGNSFLNNFLESSPEEQEELMTIAKEISEIDRQRFIRGFSESLVTGELETQEFMDLRAFLVVCNSESWNQVP